MPTPIDPIATVIADLRAGREKIAALPLEGVVLYFANGMALTFEGDKPEGHRACGLAFARIFTDAERGLGDGNQPHPILRNAYQNGAGERAWLRSLSWARRDALDRMDKVIAELETALATKL